MIALMQESQYKCGFPYNSTITVWLICLISNMLSQTISDA